MADFHKKRIAGYEFMGKLSFKDYSGTFSWMEKKA